ncbi:DNA polymerase III subunit alpha [Aquimarina sp. 2201CG5-10]|uniref:DNA polymerase III subunit alpha n=1 Tax=Aquimarina callyspongiae TaxID=3098150 RepID=UPI002AB44244|nr:DNA polymerase III subunit alpha [Aquimarina sp. 2201CG5-10]MDY8138315.1 DNA polymerase III subunit alpha [Aquimarina sp. 2201CG5-10]
MYLNCHSYYSLRFGTFSEIDLLELAQQNQVKCLALTDINNTSACLNFIRKAKDYQIKPIIGIDFRNNHQPLYVGLAKNNEGYKELNDFLAYHLHKKKSFPNIAPDFKNAFIIYPFKQILSSQKINFASNEFIGICSKDLTKLTFSRYKKLRKKLIVLQPVTFRNKKDFNAHRLLRSIDNNILLSRLSDDQQACFSEQMIPEDEIIKQFSEFNFIIENTIKVLNQCHIEFDFSKNKPPLNQKTYTGNIQDDYKLLKKLCKQGLSYRYPTADQKVLARLKKELSLISKMNFIPYFLINWRIINYAQSKGYYYVGRGSGANSIVAYLLRITDVDPIELDLYFERFINSHRTSPPDFDIDFSWKDRQDITRFIFKEFNHVALLGAYVTFHYKGAVREIGKVFGLPKFEIDKLSEGDYNYNSLDHIHKLVIIYSRLIQGIPNYISIHASGILVSEKPLHYYSATDLPPKGFPTVQFDMIIAEDLGLYKYDILGQRGLAKIKDAIRIIQYNQPQKANFDIHDINRFKKDDKINSLIRDAKCLACFYVESPAMRMLLSKLKTDNYLGLVAASSIIRPGVAKSGMMREYILREHDKERRKNSHPIMLDLMSDTHGIMVYQEDVIKVAHFFAKLTLDEADVLRRGMSGKFRSREEFKQVKNKFINNCRTEGYKEHLISEIWNQVASFAGYAFPKGHSASYAVESYQSLFLKAYFPIEYLVATLNNGGGFYRPEVYLHEAKLFGAKIIPPCINTSQYEHILQDKTIFLGFMILRNLDHKTIESILTDRNKNGNYSSLDNFINRVPIGIEQISILIKIGAFEFTKKNKHELLWQAYFKMNNTDYSNKNQPLLFTQKRKEYTLPKLTASSLEIAFEQIESFGFPLSGYYQILASDIQNKNRANQLKQYLNKNIDIYGYLIAMKSTRTSNGKRMAFGTFLDQFGDIFDTVLFPKVQEKYKLKYKGVYRIYGKVVEEFGFLSIEIIKILKQDYIPDPRYAETPITTNI